MAIFSCSSLPRSHHLLTVVWPSGQSTSLRTTSLSSHAAEGNRARVTANINIPVPSDRFDEGLDGPALTCRIFLVIFHQQEVSCRFLSFKLKMARTSLRELTPHLPSHAYSQKHTAFQLPSPVAL